LAPFFHKFLRAFGGGQIKKQREMGEGTDLIERKLSKRCQARFFQARFLIWDLE